MGLKLLVIGLSCFVLGFFVGTGITYAALERVLKDYERALKTILDKCFTDPDNDEFTT